MDRYWLHPSSMDRYWLHPAFPKWVVRGLAMPRMSMGVAPARARAVLADERRRTVRVAGVGAEAVAEAMSVPASAPASAPVPVPLSVFLCPIDTAPDSSLGVSVSISIS